MRSYIAVDPGIPICQAGEKLRFAVAPVMTNTGFTPARNVCHRIKVAILDLSNGKDHVFDDSGELAKTDAGLPPRQTFVLNGIVADHYSDADVLQIMEGKTRRLFTWGTVTYDDIFGNSWSTNFCHNYVFYKDEKETIRFFSYHFQNHNNAT